jgi:hypothetical protein
LGLGENALCGSAARLAKTGVNVIFDRRANIDPDQKSVARQGIKIIECVSDMAAQIILRQRERARA